LGINIHCHTCCALSSKTTRWSARSWPQSWRERCLGRDNREGPTNVGREGGGLKIQRLVLSEPICEPTIEPFPETPMIVYGRGSIQACGFRRRDELPWVPPAGHHGTPTARCIARGRIRSGGIVAGRPDPCGETRCPQLSMRFANCRASDGQGIYVLKSGRLCWERDGKCVQQKIGRTCPTTLTGPAPT